MSISKSHIIYIIKSFIVFPQIFSPVYRRKIPKLLKDRIGYIKGKECIYRAFRYMQKGLKGAFIKLSAAAFVSLLQVAASISSWVFSMTKSKTSLFIIIRLFLLIFVYILPCLSSHCKFTFAQSHILLTAFIKPGSLLLNSAVCDFFLMSYSSSSS